MTFIKYIKIIIISIILLFNTLVEGYEPLARYGHGSIVIGNNLYFFGGFVRETDGKEINTNDFFYIDLSKPFDRLNPQYIDLKTLSSPPVKFSQGSLAPNSQGTGFHVIGGVLDDINNNEPFYDNFVYEYEETTKSWSVPKISNSPKYSQLKEFDSVHDNGKSYIFGGINADNPKTILELQIFDSESLSWSLGSNKIPNLQALFDYTATLLPDGIIVYIGGASNPLSDVCNLLL
jgi:N-acetylneuraminic acid mutarotase